MTDLVKLTRYQQWANQKTAEPLQSLPADVADKELGGSFPTIRLTLLHMLQADYRWLHRLNGVLIVEIPATWQNETLPALINLWLDVQDQLLKRTGELAPQGNPMIKFTTAKGDTYQLPLEEVITHVVNHSTYHRGQLVNMMRMVGAKAESTDYFLFVVNDLK
ncbi:MAG: hypothetical protein E6Q41_00480 [Cyclobacteriaceae bacterium]|nr:MAG: hypothetical protein E6Q41_00480 [Cyclobacteriaceae bacterium]